MISADTGNRNVPVRRAGEAPRQEDTLPEPEAGFPPGTGRFAVIY